MAGNIRMVFFDMDNNFIACQRIDVGNKNFVLS